MYKITFLVFILFSISCFSQIDSLSIRKESHFKVATTVLKNSIFSVSGDFTEMVHSVTSNWKQTALYAGGIVGLLATDKITTGFLHNYIEPTINYSLPKIDVIKTGLDWADGNNTYILYPILGLYTGSLLANHKKDKR